MAYLVDTSDWVFVEIAVATGNWSPGRVGLLVHIIRFEVGFNNACSAAEFDSLASLVLLLEAFLLPIGNFTDIEGTLLFAVGGVFTVESLGLRFARVVLEGGLIERSLLHLNRELFS